MDILFESRDTASDEDLLGCDENSVSVEPFWRYETIIDVLYHYFILCGV